jgi:hypothetical protein
MAANPAAARLTEAHRLAQGRLGAQAVARMLAAWPLLDMEDLDGTVDRWLRVTVPIITGQRSTSARLAANYLTTFRALELGAGVATFTPIVADRPPVEAVVTSLTVTGPASVKSAMTRGVQLAQAADVARARSSASAMRHVLGGARDTITATVAEDPRALGWARATSGRPCAFCAMVASRGPVYKEQGTADFQPHDGCHCEPEAVYRRDAAWPSGSERFRAVWEQAAAEDGDTTKNFRRLIEAA